MKHLALLALAITSSATAFAETAPQLPPTSRFVSVKIAKHGEPVSQPSFIVNDTECTTMTSTTANVPDMISVAVCPVSNDKLVVTWMVRDGDRTEAAGAVGSTAHGASFDASVGHGIPRRFDVSVSIK
jgi:hypothetical protein